MVLVALIQGGCAVQHKGAATDVIHEVSDSRFDRFLLDMQVREHFSGVALVMQEGRVIHAKGYGVARGDVANSVDTRFHVGSITKQFTAAAVMQLVEKGLVDLDAPINSYLPAKYRSPKWDAVTVHHLLSHTSGIADYAITRNYYDVTRGFCSDATVDGMVKEAMGKSLEFVPGSRFSYSNLGYTLLGSIIETRANASYGEYVERNIFAPMRMTSSSIHRADHVPAADEARGLRWSEGQKKHLPDDAIALPATAPDGGLITTLNDFARWARIFTAPEQSVLTQASIELMSKPAIAIGAGGPLDAMGYGLYVGDRLIGHSGLVIGFSSQFVFDRETRSLIAVFSNDASSNPQRITFGLLTILLTPGSRPGEEHVAQ